MFKKVEGGLESPNEINLRQAIHWVAFGMKPLQVEYETALRPLKICPEKPDIFLLPINEITNNIEWAKKLLFVELRKGNITATGYPMRSSSYDYPDPYCFPDLAADGGYASYGSPYDMNLVPMVEYPRLPDGSRRLYNLVEIDGFEFAPGIIPSAHWSFQMVDWDNSLLTKWFDDEDAEGLHYCKVRLPWQVISSLHLKEEDTDFNPNRPGRPARYNWAEFYVEIIKQANKPDGLPVIQAELENYMQQWCINNNWPGPPGISTIRAKISPIYQTLKKASK